MGQTTSRIVFMGTPDFAVPTLEALLEARDFGGRHRHAGARPTGGPGAVRWSPSSGSG